MTIPTHEAVMLPVLQRCASRPWPMRDLVAQIADDLKLSATERDELLPSGGATIIASRVGWAKTFLKQAGLLEQPRRGIVQITVRGREVLVSHPAKIDLALLKRFPEFNAFLRRSRTSDAPVSNGSETLGPEPSSTPEEQITSASKLLSETLRDALLARVLESTPAFFEKLIVDLLLAMGYGGSRADAGEQLGKSGDGGIDGIIREDQLGLDRVYLQAKRYQPGNSVGSETVQAFIGALVGRGAQKGVLITTSTFTKAAQMAASQSGGLRLVLIDGPALMELMIRFGVGVRVASTVEIKRLDLDYFEDAETE